MPPVSIPYARSQPFDNDAYVRAMSELMLQRNQAAAAATLARGQNSQQMWTGLGRMTMAAMGQIGEQHDEARKLAAAERQKAIDNAMREKEFAERQADREADIKWRQQQAETEQKRYDYTLGDKTADDVEANTAPTPEQWSVISRSPAAAGRFRTTAPIPAQPAWEAPAEGDAMADAGPATGAVPMSHLRNPTGQEALQLRAAALAEQDRTERNRQFTLNQGDEIRREQQAQANADRNYNEGVREFGITSGRLDRAARGGELGLGPLENMTPEQIKANLPPSTAALLKAVGEDYTQDITKVTSLRGDQRQKFAQLVSLVYPEYDASQYNVRSKLRADFTSGKTSSNLKSMNQLVGHMADLDAKAQELGNGRFPIFNKVKNKWEEETGSATQNNFAIAANAVESEAANVFKGTGATDQEIAEWRQTIRKDMSPAALLGMRQTLLGLLGSRLAATVNQYETGMGAPKKFDILSPKTRKVLSQWGFNPNEWDHPVENPTIDPGEYDFFNTIRMKGQQDQQPMFGPRAPIAPAPSGPPPAGIQFGPRG